jgi:hypothetical protein
VNGAVAILTAKGNDNETWEGKRRGKEVEVENPEKRYNQQARFLSLHLGAYPFPALPISRFPKTGPAGESSPCRQPDNVLREG